jgi:hypothetical protein
LPSYKIRRRIIIRIIRDIKILNLHKIKLKKKKPFLKKEKREEKRRKKS